MVGYEGLMTWIFRKFGVPLDGLQFPMGPNNKIGAKCLNNLHLKLNDKGILEDAIEEVEDVESEDEKDEEEREEKEEKQKEEKDQENKDQEPVPSATTEKAEACFQGE